MDNTFNYLSLVKVAFLLGAGTSTHMHLCGNSTCSVPMDRDFFLRASTVRNWCTDPKLIGIGIAAYALVTHTLQAHGVSITQLLPGPGDSPPTISMEDAFCRLELLRMMGVSTKSRRWKHAADAFRDLIAIVISSGQLPSGDVTRGYHGFVRALRSATHVRKLALLTLNYELGLEQAVEAHYAHDPHAFGTVGQLARLGQHGINHWVMRCFGHKTLRELPVVEPACLPP